MRVAFCVIGVWVLGLAACSPPSSPPETGSAAPAEQTLPSQPAPVQQAVVVEGWQTDTTSYTLSGQTLPSLPAKATDQGLSEEALRGHRTIIGFSQPSDKADEINYVAALNSAAGQDPDLSFMSVIAAPSAAPAWPHVTDDGTIASALSISTTPAYLLIGPDLTIEAYRGALTATSDDGIKSVIRGVAEIRKQVAAPE